MKESVDIRIIEPVERRSCARNMVSTLLSSSINVKQQQSIKSVIGYHPHTHTHIHMHTHTHTCTHAHTHTPAHTLTHTHIHTHTHTSTYIDPTFFIAISWHGVAPYHETATATTT